MRRRGRAVLRAMALPGVFVGLMAVGLLLLGVAAQDEEPAPPAPSAIPAAAGGATDFRPGKPGTLEALPLPAPEAFTTEGGRKGWRVKIPGGRPLATPAVVGGTLYVGGGFGSHEFYALDARTGARAWTFRTGDDGPTAAVVADRCVAYNTESCTVYVHDAITGKVLWSKWLGDPLMSQPAVADGRLFMAYPGEGGHHLAAFELRTGRVLWDRRIEAEVISAPVVDGGWVYVTTVDGTLYRFNARTGEMTWSVMCKATSAPRVAGGKVYISQRAVREIEITVGEGEKAEKKTSPVTVEGFNVADARTGKLAYEKPQAAVKAAYLLDIGRNRLALVANSDVSWNGQLEGRGAAGLYTNYWDATRDAGGSHAMALRERVDAWVKSKPSADPEGAKKDVENALALAGEIERAAESIDPKASPDAARARTGLKKAVAEMRATAAKTKDAAETAEQLASTAKAVQRELKEANQLDADVGFASAPAAAKLTLAENNLGQGNVKAVWAFQGSRPCLVGADCVSVNGTAFRSVSGRNGKARWERELKSGADATRPATPPALAGGRLYLGTADGRILCADAKNGKTLWETKVGGNILFEPAVAAGRVYVATNDGMVICLETGDETADGWPMWGGSAGHNGGGR